jgi:membrane dipeptidase
MASIMRPRLISKEQAKIIAAADGVIGVWTHLADSALEYAQNIGALVDVVGVDHVCIGTDTKLTGSYRSPVNASPRRGEPATTRANSNQNGVRVGERTNLTWQDQQFGFYYTLVDSMLKTGFHSDEIAKIGGGNFCRIFDASTRS